MDEKSLKCDKCKDNDALALEVCGSAGANHAAHRCQGMHLAFFTPKDARLYPARDGTVHTESFGQCHAADGWHAHLRGSLCVYQSMDTHFFVCMQGQHGLQTNMQTA